MTARNKNSYQTFIYDFVKDILVVCPKCLKNAVVKPDGFSFRDYHHKDIKVICISCGFNKKLPEEPTSVINGVTIEGLHPIIGAPIDPFFNLPLWLKENINGNIL